MSDELIEAMARELSKHLWVVVNGDDDCGDWEEMPEMVQTSYKMVARALIPIIRAHLEPTSEMVEAACRVRPASHMWPDRYTDSLQAFERKFAKAAIIAALAASPIGGENER